MIGRGPSLPSYVESDDDDDDGHGDQEEPASRFFVDNFFSFSREMSTARASQPHPNRMTNCYTF